MARPNFFLPLLAFLMVALFVWLLIELLLLRYERGDIYPAYSTLRADPLGIRAFYEALDDTGRYRAARGFTSLHRELADKPNALFYLGLGQEEIATFSKDEIAALDTYVRDGGRVIVTLEPELPISSSDDSKAPAHWDPSSPKKEVAKEEPPPPEDKAPADDASSSGPQTRQEKYEREQLRRDTSKDDPERDKNAEPVEYHQTLSALWGFGVERHETSENKDGSKVKTPTPDTDDDAPPEVFALNSMPGAIEEKVPWKSALYFVRLEPEWESMYYAKAKPVMIRRHWGRGEILMASDSYFISNEALRNNRTPQLLSLVAGWPGRLLFDEAHLGTEQQEGVMTLAEKFRLEGFLYGLLGVTALFLWHNSVPLVPPRTMDGRTGKSGTVPGRDSRSGLVNLLRRNIPPSEILKVCLGEWKKSVAPRRSLPEQVARMESIVSRSEPAHLVEVYHELRKINAPARAQGIHATKS